MKRLEMDGARLPKFSPYLVLGLFVSVFLHTPRAQAVSAAQVRESDEDGEHELTAIINTFKDHPSLLVWELLDEPLWKVWCRFPWIFGGQQQELRKHIEQTKKQPTGEFLLCLTQNAIERSR